MSLQALEATGLKPCLWQDLIVLMIVTIFMKLCRSWCE